MLIRASAMVIALYFVTGGQTAKQETYELQQQITQHASQEVGKKAIEYCANNQKNCKNVATALLDNNNNSTANDKTNNQHSVNYGKTIKHTKIRTNNLKNKIPIPPERPSMIFMPNNS